MRRLFAKPFNLLAIADVAPSLRMDGQYPAQPKSIRTIDRWHEKCSLVEQGGGPSASTDPASSDPGWG